MANKFSHTQSTKTQQSRLKNQQHPVSSAQNVVDVIRERRPIPNPYRVGDICTLLVKGNSELRGRGGQWCLIETVHTFSCTVRTWDTQIQVRLENLLERYYSPQQRETMRQWCDRLHRLLQADLEPAALAMLESLGKLDRPFLTPLEEKLLALLEVEIQSK